MSDRPIKVFLSYARKDAPHHECIVEILEGLKNQGRIEPWWDGLVNAGGDWNEEILKALEEAEMILLLVSRPFLASSFCYRIEMQRAMQRHDQGAARVIPIVLRACHWGRTPFAKLQAPEAANPILGVRGHRRDTLLQNIARALDDAATLLAARKAGATAIPPSAPMPDQDHLPPRPPHCFGRTAVIERLVAGLCAEPAGPIVVTGGPGFGKSTVTLRALHDPRTVRHYGGRRWFVRLDGAISAEGVWSGIAETLGVPSGASLRSAVCNCLAETPAALALDNFETPWHADMVGSEEVLADLAAIPCCVLVVTIRGGERPGRVGWAAAPAIQPLAFEDARAAFLAVAGDSFAGDPHLDDLVRAQDGIPLALDLLAHACQAEPDLSCPWRRWQAEKTEMLQRGDVEDRLCNIGTSFELSIAGPRMTADGRRLLGLLGILPDGIADEDLAALLPEGGDRAAAVLIALGLAFRQSGRLRVLAPIREYVASRHPPAPADLDRCVSHFVRLARDLGEKPGREGGAEALARLTPETGNLETVLDRALCVADPVPGIEAVIAYGRFQRYAGYRSLTLLDRAAACAAGAGRMDLEARSQNQAGDIALDCSDHATARARYEHAVKLFRRVGSVLGEANCTKSLGEIARRRSDHETARARFEEALRLYRQVETVLGEASCIARLGEIALERSNHAFAQDRFEAALELFRRVQSVLGEANCIRSLGNTAFGRSDYEAARARFVDALPLYRRIGDVLGEANCIQSLGDIALECSAPETARLRYEEALPLFQRIGDVLGEANCIKRLGDIALARSDHGTARSRFEAALRLYRSVGSTLGEANCIRSLGDIRLADGDTDGARTDWTQALALYGRIPEPFSIGDTYRRLARVAPTATERRDHVAAARTAWVSIKRDDLVAELDAEFGPA